MRKLPIIMNAADHEELWCAIAAAGRLNERARAEVSALRSELERAEIVGSDKIPADVITMNSRAELLDLDTNERMEFTLVFPSEVEWVVPYGRRRLKVATVRFQPEAALATTNGSREFKKFGA
jgi:regulator of nucleoside diphosphate kinase